MKGIFILEFLACILYFNFHVELNVVFYSSSFFSVKPENKVTCNWWLLTADAYNLQLEKVEYSEPNMFFNTLESSYIVLSNIEIWDKKARFTFNARKYILHFRSQKILLSTSAIFSFCIW